MAAFYPTEDLEGSKFHVRSQTFIFTGTTATRGSAADWSNNDGEYGSGLNLEKLKIGSPLKRNVCPIESSPLMLCDSDNSSRPSSPPRTIESRPLWKDYPSVEKSFPSGHSFCSSPTSSYTASPLCSPVGFNGFKPNYKSSSIGTIFGSHKTLLSPPKLDITNWGFQRQDGDNISVCGSSAYPTRSSNGPVFLENGSTYQHTCRPVSRASSQSSGFVSQNGYYTPPPSLQGFRVAPSVTETLRNKSQHFDSGASVRSKMSWYSSSNTEENGIHPGYHNSLFGSACSHSQTRSSSYDTCSRFARSSDDRNKCFGISQQRNRSRRSNSNEITDDEVDDDSASFCTARTSGTVIRKPAFGCASSGGIHDGLRQRNGGNEAKGVTLRNLRSSEFGENQTSTASVCTRVARFTWNLAKNMLLLVGVIIMLMLLGMIFTDLRGDKVNEYIRYLITYISVFYTYLEKLLKEEYHNLLAHYELGVFRVKEKIMELLFAKRL